MRLPFGWHLSKAQAPPPASKHAAPLTLSLTPHRRDRLSIDDPTTSLLSGLTLLAPPDQENRWRDLLLDARTFDRLSPAELIELLIDLSPDMSRAVWDLLRFFNPGWECEALAPGGEEVDARGQAVLDAFTDRLRTLYGSADVPFNRLSLSAFVRGGFFAELILDRRGREGLDLATPDPRWLYFRQATDPDRGRVWVPYQWQGGQQVDLLRDTIRYVPVDPMPGKPYGRAPLSPCLFPAVFVLAMLHDLRRVVQQQGYPRLDISINLETLLASMPEALKNDLEQRQAWLSAVEAEVRKAYDALRPEDAYLHTSVIEVNRPVGTVDSSSLGAIDGLIAALERMETRAAKTIPLLMAIPEGMSEANANRQWESYIQGIKALQHLEEGVLEHFGNLLLRAAGSQATCRFRFAENRAAELLRDAQVENLKTINAFNQYQAGYLAQDEAAKKATGKDVADQPAPRGPLGTGGVAGQNAPGSAQPEPGANREQVKEGLLTMLGYDGRG